MYILGKKDLTPRLYFTILRPSENLGGIPLRKRVLHFWDKTPTLVRARGASQGH